MSFFEIKNDFVVAWSKNKINVSWLLLSWNNPAVLCQKKLNLPTQIDTIDLS